MDGCSIRKAAGSGAWADWPRIRHEAFVSALLLRGTQKVKVGIVALEESETHFAEAKSPDQLSQGLVQMGQIARFEDGGRLGAREIDGVTSDRNGSQYEGSHVALPLTAPLATTFPSTIRLCWYCSDWSTN